MTLFGFLIAVIANLLRYILSYEPCSRLFITNPLTAASYPARLPVFRQKCLKHLENATYLDYTGAGVYNDLDIDLWRRTILVPGNDTSQHNQELINETRTRVLHFLGTDSSAYSLIFTASATQALKIVGEYYPWAPGTEFTYGRINHNSVLGIRRYAIANGATFSVVNSSIEIVPNPNRLYAIALEDNFAGTKPGIGEMRRLTHTEDITVVADAAAYLGSNRLNLTDTPFHAVVLSFYKVFGFPNFGALVIRKDFASKLVKNTFTEHSKSGEDFLEDDRAPMPMVHAVLIGLHSFEALGIDNINRHVWQLTRQLYEGIDKLRHSSGVKLAEIYGNHAMNDADRQGGIVAFNVKGPNGDYIGYADVVKRASQSRFHLRGGCHCNPGACFLAMKLGEAQVKVYFDKKTTCGDSNDIIDGVPLGSVRASLGWASTMEDVNKFVNWLSDVFIL
jgi:molybdenum cofactor sulfurtransferase